MPVAAAVRVPLFLLVLAGTAAAAWLALGAIAAPGAAAAPTCTITWGGATSTDWDTPTNWTPARVPVATDVVCMAATPTRLGVQATSDHTVKGIVFTRPGSSLTVAGGVTTVTEPAGSANGSALTRLVTAGGTWSGDLAATSVALTSGTLAGGTVTTTGTSTACTATLDAATLVNQGTLTYDTSSSCYHLVLQNGSQLTNAASGTLVLTGGGVWGLLDGGGATANRVVNNGAVTVSLSTAAAVSSASVPFANLGSVTATRGHLALAGGGVPGTPDTGSYAIAATGAVDLTGGTRTVSIVAATGAGRITVAGGTTVYTQGTVANLTITGGSLGGTVAIGSLRSTGGR